MFFCRYFSSSGKHQNKLASQVKGQSLFITDTIRFSLASIPFFVMYFILLNLVAI
jgi:hypothetical protein